MPKTPLRAFLLAACGIAALASGWRASGDRFALAETGMIGMVDTDGDLVPDSVEWLMQTDPGIVDTHDDGIDDFMAILSYQNLLLRDVEPLPMDHGMRVMVTSAPDTHNNVSVWLHIMVRFVGVENANHIWVDPYIDVGGYKVSLIPAIGYGGIHIASRRSGENTMFFISCELVDENALTRLLPCTIGADGFFDHKHVNAGSFLIPAGTAPQVLLPRGEDSFIVQPINTATRFQDPGPGLKGGRVCAMKLAVISASSAGHLCEVVSADCEAAAGLNCATTGPSACANTVGQPFFVQGGLGAITGR